MLHGCQNCCLQISCKPKQLLVKVWRNGIMNVKHLFENFVHHECTCSFLRNEEFSCVWDLAFNLATSKKTFWIPSSCLSSDMLPHHRHAAPCIPSFHSAYRRLITASVSSVLIHSRRARQGHCFSYQRQLLVPGKKSPIGDQKSVKQCVLCVALESTRDPHTHHRNYSSSSGQILLGD